jgi:hypothetical protein
MPMKVDMTRRRWLVAPVLAVLGLAPASAMGASTGAAVTGGPVQAPPVHGTFDYQIGGAYPPAASVDIVDRDRHAEAVPSAYSICYLNAYQTQPGTLSWWRAHHPRLLLRAGGGFVEDPGWPGEYLLDTSTAAKRMRLADVLGRWIDGCAARGYEGVEPDNLDSFTRSRGLLSRGDNFSLARLMVGRAHADGVAIAQKNTAGASAAGRNRVGFDFAIAEECQRYRECGQYLSAYGRHVIEIEYTDYPRQVFTAACAARGGRISIVLRDRDVVPRGDAGYVERWC